MIHEAITDSLFKTSPPLVLGQALGYHVVEREAI